MEPGGEIRSGGQRSGRGCGGQRKKFGFSFGKMRSSEEGIILRRDMTLCISLGLPRSRYEDGLHVQGFN